METRLNKPTLFNIWTAYATYYFGRVNLSMVVPVLLVAYKDLSLYNVGLVSSGFFFAYAVGQFLHGQMSEKHNPFIYIGVGLILSGIFNCLLGFFAGYFLILLVGEILDGFVQAMGWSSSVRANALTQKNKNVEKSSIILGTSYQMGNSVAWLISAFAVGQWGWRAGFFIASAFLIVRGILLLSIRPKIKLKKTNKINIQIKKTLSVPIVLSGLSLCLLNMVRYGVITWIPLYLFQSNNLTVQDMGKIGLKIFLIPVAGVLGTLLYNKIKFNKNILTIFYLCLLSLTIFLFPIVNNFFMVIVLLLSGFFLYGPHVFLVTTFPSRYLDKQVVAASTGFINGMGYVGTVLIGIIVPFLISLNGNWNGVFMFWGILPIVISFLMIICYRIKK